MNSPKIKYVSIVFETKKIICEYKEEEIKNIQKIIRKILDKNVKTNEISSVVYDDDFSVFYKNDGLITVLCATDLDYPNSNAYEFIKELNDIFRKNYDEKEIKEAYSFAFNNKFKQTIKSKISYYNNNLDSKDSANLLKLKDNLLDTKDNLIETTQVLHLREMELSHNIQKAEELKINMDELLTNAIKVKKAQMYSPYKKIIYPIIIIIVVYCILVIICGGMSIPNCSI